MTGARIAAAIRPTSDAVDRRARFWVSTGRSRKNTPNAKYRMPIQGRVASLPKTAHENRKLIRVAAIAARLNM